VGTGTGTATLKISNAYNGTGSGSGLITVNATTTYAYVNSSWNFTTAGTWQDVIIEHVEAAKLYRIRMEIGSAYNNNTFAGYQI
jgi:hypothetical protein